MHISVLALNGVFDSGLSLLLDTFDTANQLATAPAHRFDVSLVGVRAQVATNAGCQVPVRSVTSTPALVIVPALGSKTPAALASALATSEVRDGMNALRGWADSGAQIAAACTATFVVADAGLLVGRRATTTWWLAAFFRQRFPAIALDESAMVVEAGGIVTAGSALAHLDLALWLVHQRSPSLAREVGSFLLYDRRPSQARFVLPDHLARADELVATFERWARSNLAGFSLADAARACRTSERTLERRVRAVTGRSPVAFVRELRVAHALHLLATTDASVDAIAAEVGYSDAVTLRTLLRDKTGRGIRDLRRGRASA
jgi:transcriptional regulator GlxA family with amidase domain